MIATAGPSREGTTIEGAVPDCSVPDRTAAVVRGLRVVLEHHEATEFVICSILEQLSQYLDSSDSEQVWVKRLKYCLARPLAEYLRNELPPAADLPFEYGGLARRWMRNRLICFNRRNTHLWYSWFQAKRACLPSSEDFIEEVYGGHLEALTGKDPGDEMAIDAAFSDPTFFNVLVKLRKGIDLLLGRPLTRWSASVSACFDRTRAQGGQHEDLIDWTFRHDIFRREWDTLHHVTHLHDMIYFENIVDWGAGTVERREPDGREDWSDLDQLSRSYRWWDSPLSCEIRGVVEPLKVRVISKGESLPYYSQKDLQKILHDQMREMSCFRLLDKPFSATHLFDLRKKESHGLKWFSVDYSAATDGLSWTFSSRILRVLLAHQSDDVLNRALRVLGPHHLYYPKAKGGRERRGLQSNGQLMGSILSFPILCLANLAVYLIVNSIRHRDWTDKERLESVLINGDDMLYCAPENLWDRHVKVSGDLGLKMSVGKAYLHDRYANVNSTSVICDLNNERSTPYEVPYLNVGLYFQSAVQKKVTTDIEQERKEAESSLRALGLPIPVYPEEGVTSSIPALLGGCLDSRRQRTILSAYLVRNAKAITDETLVSSVTGGKRCVGHRNLFVHSSLGGMGIEPPLGWKFKIKRFDHRLARSILNGRSASVRPLPGYEVDCLKPLAVPWTKRAVIPDVPFVPLDKGGSLTRSDMIQGLSFWSDKRNCVLVRAS
jgi:hypothetical protein